MRTGKWNIVAGCCGLGAPPACVHIGGISMIVAIAWLGVAVARLPTLPLPAAPART